MIADLCSGRTYTSTEFHGYWRPGDPRSSLGYVREESSVLKQHPIFDAGPRAVLLLSASLVILAALLAYISTPLYIKPQLRLVPLRRTSKYLISRQGRCDIHEHHGHVCRLVPITTEARTRFKTFLRHLRITRA